MLQTLYIRMFDFELCPHVENVEGEDMMTKPGL